MTENTRSHSFDIKPIMYEIEKGLNNLLNNYLDRYELLEKTHQQLIRLPSIVDELNKRNDKDCSNRSESVSVPVQVIQKPWISDFMSIKNMTEDIMRTSVSGLENKLNIIDQKYDAITPILDKLNDKIINLDNDIKGIQNSNNDKNKEVVYGDIAEKSSVVDSCENENIKICIEETEKNEKNTHDIVVENKETIIISDIKEVEDNDEEEENVVAVIEDDEEISIETESKEDEEEISIETESKEDEEEDEDDEEIFEIEIDDKNYCTNNDDNGFIWELSDDGEQGDKVGYFKESEPFFYAEEN